ncbi:phosphatidylserine decarboxylase [Desulforhabdus sp. TSK]|uniref:phosphatidylserine decarboxylase n=1 Tax=Desulforhabdus sp. TSK TaxID=2925014 RepID=UPI0034D68080
MGMKHQYIERQTGKVRSEQLYGDRIIRRLYGRERENGQTLFRALTSARFSAFLGYIHYDFSLGGRVPGYSKFLQEAGIDFNECLENFRHFKTMREIFERKIRYWECRPMPKASRTVASPADARVLVGSFHSSSSLFLKEKFFDYEELLGTNKQKWLNAFQGGDFAVFRLTPEKYHYNHAPVSGKVLDIYEISGTYNSCNPSAVVAAINPYSKNKRVVTILDTNVPGGSEAGMVAMIEIVALMVGDVVQCYSETRYDAPQPVRPGMFLRKGCPKSLYRPGSSTDVLIFQSGRVAFASDLVRNLRAPGVESRFSLGFGRPLVETEVLVRSCIAEII